MIAMTTGIVMVLAQMVMLMMMQWVMAVTRITTKTRIQEGGDDEGDAGDCHMGLCDQQDDWSDLKYRSLIMTVACMRSNSVNSAIISAPTLGMIFTASSPPPPLSKFLPQSSLLP